MVYEVQLADGETNQGGERTEWKCALELFWGSICQRAALHCGQPQTLSWDDPFQVCQGSGIEIRMFVSLLPVVHGGSVLSRSVQETHLVLKANYSGCLAKYSDVKQRQS